MTISTKTMPDYLKDTGRAWVQKVAKDFSYTTTELETIFQAAECIDRIDQARREIKKRGITVKDRYGVPKINPAFTIERDSKVLFDRLCKTLKINKKESEE